jgi:hypothetical protein
LKSRKRHGKSRQVTGDDIAISNFQEKSMDPTIRYNDATDTVTCGLCGRVTGLDTAIEAGWQPCWWARDPVTGELRSDDTPACPTCAAAYLVDDGDGEGDGLVLRESAPMPDVVACRLP